MQLFDLSNPEVRVSIIADRPTMIEFHVPVEGFERPAAVLFQAVAEYLGTHALESLDIDAFQIRYLLNENSQQVLIGTLYTRTPLPWVEYNADGV